MYVGINVNYPLFMSEFSATYNILDKITKNIQISNLMKIRPVVAEVFHVDRRTDGYTDNTKLIVTLRSFLERAKIQVRSIIIRSLPLVAGRNIRPGSRVRTV
jgi:hypothetical protein